MADERSTAIPVSSIQGDLDNNVPLKKQMELNDGGNAVEMSVMPTEPPKRPIPWLPWQANGLMKECLAEFWGTFILIMFGDGVVASVVVGNNLLGATCPVDGLCDATPGGGWLSINIAWGLGVLFGVLSSAKISGAHLNPAVSFSLACTGRFPWYKVIPYSVSQILGAFVAAAVIFSVYLKGLNRFDPDRTMATAGIFSTYPKFWQSNLASFWNEVVGTALLMTLIFAIGDGRNVGLTAQQGPFAVALAVLVIGQSWGIQTGYAINPARDFGPRLLASMAGWGGSVFSASNYYFWVPIVGPLVGGPIGAFLYMLFVEQHHDL